MESKEVAQELLRIAKNLSATGITDVAENLERKLKAVQRANDELAKELAKAEKVIAKYWNDGFFSNESVRRDIKAAVTGIEKGQQDVALLVGDTILRDIEELGVMFDIGGR